MQISRLTYPTVRVFLALALLVSVSAPLVKHMCGDANANDRPLLTEARQTSGSLLASYLQTDHSGIHAALCGDMEPAVPICEWELCTLESDTQRLAVHSEKPSVRLDLAPALLVERISTELFFSAPPVLRWSADTPGVRSLIPARLLTSTFLL